MGPIENVGVMDDTDPKGVKLDNLANVRFCQDAGNICSIYIIKHAIVSENTPAVVTYIQNEANTLVFNLLI